jgi:hypothetical protein
MWEEWLPLRKAGLNNSRARFHIKSTPVRAALIKEAVEIDLSATLQV